jgi:SPP1 family predicted phage head-tail adaptor
MPAISELNRVITIRHVAIAANERLLPIKLITSSQTTFAKVKKLNGSYGLQQGQTNFSSTYDMTVRYEPSRVIANNDIIEYAGDKYTINDTTQQEEGNKQWVVIRCTKDDHSGQTSGIDDMIQAIKEIHETGNVVIGGADYSNWAGSIVAFRDGIQFTVKRDGSAQDKQINYDAATGLFTYPADLQPLQPKEPTDIYFI